MAPLLVHTNVSSNTDDLELRSGRTKAAAIQRIESTEDHKDLWKTIVEDISTFDMDTLADLEFLRGTRHHKSKSTSKPKTTSGKVPTLSVINDVEAHMDDDVGAISPAQRELLRARKLVLGLVLTGSHSRLSVRKTFPREEMKAHHQRYTRKFELELDKSNYRLQAYKDDECDNDERPTTKKRRVATSRNSNNINNISIEEELIDLIEVIDSLENITDHTSTVSLCLQQLFTKLNTIRNTEFNKIDVHVLLRIEEQTFSLLCQSSDTNWKSLEHLRDPRAVKSLLSLSKDLFTACKILTLILNSDRQEKQLYLYDYLALVINFIATFCREGLMPLAKVTVLNSIIVNSFRGAFSAVCSEIEHTIELLKCHVNKREVNEDLLTKLEYTIMSFIFSESNSRDKSSVIGVHQVELLKMSLSNLCATIFKKNPNQRSFILSELLSNAYKIPLLKSAARQFKTSRGTSIHLLTSTLLNLLQTFYFEIDHNYEHHHGDNETKLILELAQISYEDGERFATEISQYIVSFVATNPSQANKQSLEVFITDLLNILLFPEWPGAESLLLGILTSLLTTIRAENGQDNFFLDMAGLIGVRLLTIRNNNPSALVWNFVQDDDNDEDNTTGSELAQTIRTVLDFVLQQGKKSHFYFNALQYLIVKYLHYLLPEFDSNNSELNALQSLRSGGVFRKQEREIFSLLLEAKFGLDSKTGASNAFDKVMIPYYRSIATMSIHFGIEGFLSTLVKCLDSNKATVKSRALKVLANVVNKDSKVMLVPSVRDCISRRLLDNSSSVREAVIELISKYIHSRAGVIDQYYRPICCLLFDKSIQVRRKVLKLCKGLYSGSENRSVRSYMAIEVLKLCKDEDESVRQLAKDTLVELWFPTNDKITSSESLRIAEVMMDVVYKSEDCFEQLIIDSMTNQDRQDSFENLMKLHVINILDFVVECQDTQFQLQVEKAMKLVACFTKCKHDLISQDMLSSIKPYIMDESLAKGTVGYYSIVILKISLGEMRSVRPELLESIQMHLMKNLSKYSYTELVQVVPCLWRLCEESDSTEKLANATLSCIQISRECIAEFKNKGHLERTRNLQKVLTLMSFLGTECDLDRHRDLFAKAHQMGLQENETVTSLLTRIVMMFCSSKVDEQIYTVSISALMRFCIHNPKMFNLPIVVKTLDKVFQKRVPRAILSITDAMQWLIGGKESQSSGLNAQVRENICARFVQRHLQDVLDTCVGCETKYQAGFFNFLESMLKGGFSNPKLCIPTVLAFGSSTSKRIRERAIELSKDLFAKHESLVESSYVEGIKLAASMAAAAAADHAMVVTVDYLAILYNIASQSITARKKLLSSIVKVMSANFKSTTNAKEQVTQIKFVTPRLSQIKFATIEEVCFVIYNLDQTISIGGMNFVERLDGVDEVDDEPMVELEHLLYHCQSLMLVILMRDHLASCYSITPGHLDDYRPGRSNQSLRQAPRIVTQLPFDAGNAQLSLQEPLLATEIMRVIKTTRKIMHKYA
ncbi:Sister chromatid cohesion protein 2 [Scheffersomyces spartinae]|uniref:Sister chromatid cohesion protein n=1 Tax=Scheffersomyces spartinae TaxID=45513 RepID=A0A9P8AL19_9ASCO|nr:Sister chromatid cohesion protein 2 [Scheffersomyces spartinae]KAG7195649.1 Sister chromatid cohesion protein 2 [Scheffersomyces spartinae]